MNRFFKMGRAVVAVSVLCLCIGLSTAYSSLSATPEVQFAVHQFEPILAATKQLFHDPSLQQVQSVFREFWDLVGPGGKLHPATFLEHKGHLFIEGFLLILLGYMFLQQTYKPNKTQEAQLSDKVPNL